MCIDNIIIYANSQRCHLKSVKKELQNLNQTKTCMALQKGKRQRNSNNYNIGWTYLVFACATKKQSAKNHSAEKQLRKVSIQQRNIHQKSIQHKSRWVKKITQYAWYKVKFIWRSSKDWKLLEDSTDWTMEEIIVFND